ncbi:hypothetical protein [Pandoraea sp. NPDC090278]|uniref:hypothetical protein n=1 Tax=Pandoraea sp. NPDC090278 TaxID=3364391 RepID=UPI00383AC4EF
MKAQALPDTNRIIERLNQLTHKGGAYVERTDLEWRILGRDVEKLKAQDAALGWGLYGSLMSIVGDHDEAERGFRTSLQLGKGAIFMNNWVASRVNLGYFTAAYSLAKEASVPELGMTSDRLPFLLLTGGINTADCYLKRAKDMNMDVVLPQAVMSIDEISIATELLRQAELTDEDLAAHLDLAGGVMRTRRQLFVGEQVVLVQHEEGVFSGITYVFPISGSAADIFELNCELAEAESAQDIKRHPFFDVVFSVA